MSLMPWPARCWAKLRWRRFDGARRSLKSLRDQFPRAGKQLSGAWRDCRALIGPWGWLIVVYMYIEAEDRVVVIAFHDARTSDAAIARS